MFQCKFLKATKKFLKATKKYLYFYEQANILKSGL